MLPRNFLWGNSVSSMQTEGAWDTDGKGPSVYDVKLVGEHTSDWKVAIDEYHRYSEDFDLMQEMGMNCYRFQISWTRIIPDGDGEINQKGLEFYDRFIDELIKHHIQPIACLYHFDMPLKLAEQYNGFVSRHVVDAFVRFGKVVMDRFADKINCWMIFNEQNCFMFKEGFDNSGYLKGERTIKELYTIANNSLLAYAQLASYAHTFDGLKVGGMVAYQEIYPATCKPEDVFIARKAAEFVNHDFLSFFATGHHSKEVLSYIQQNGFDELLHTEELKKLSNYQSDFLSFSYYFSVSVQADKISSDTCPNYYMEVGQQKNPHLESTEWGWQIDPLGFRNSLVEMSNRYNLPIFPVENGIGVKEVWDGQHRIQDDYRIDYHREHIRALKDASERDGVQVLGYLGWGLIDILSSKGDMDKRYGVVYVNRANHELRDLKRIPKDSYYWLKQVIQSNGENLE